MTLFHELNKAFIENKSEINSKFKNSFFDFSTDIDKIFSIFPNLRKKLEGGSDIIKETQTQLK
ncbi:MAG: hypothetical protein ACTSRI_08750 [Promethearchaeota archaeon]